MRPHVNDVEGERALNTTEKAFEKSYVEHDSTGLPYMRVQVEQVVRRNRDGNLEVVTRLRDPDEPTVYMIREWRTTLVNTDEMQTVRDDIVPLARPPGWDEFPEEPA